MKKIVFIFLLPFIIVPAYGYFFSSLLGHTYFNIKYKMPNSIRKNYLSGANVLFLDAKGEVVVKGAVHDKYDYVFTIHPEVGSCHKKENGLSYDEQKRRTLACSKKRALWVPKWINSVRYVKVIHEDCSTANLPIKIKQIRVHLLTWWVPLVHVGGKPYSSYWSRIVVNESDCL